MNMTCLLRCVLEPMPPAYLRRGHNVDTLALLCRMIRGFTQNQKRLHLKELGGW